MGTLTVKRLEALVVLLMEVSDPANLDDTTLDQLVRHSREVDQRLQKLRRRLDRVWEEKRYRDVKMELEKLSTQELARRAQAMRQAELEMRQHSTELDEEGGVDLPASELPTWAQKDSAAYIIPRILKERGVEW